jgi:hypothetical protein
MSTIQLSTRTLDGRFASGQSGNPAGKKPGTRNRATILREELREGEGNAGARVVIDKALGGDGVMARFMTKELSRPEPGHFVEFELAEDTLDAETVLKATLKALVAGKISTEAANGVARFVEACGRILGKGSTAKHADAETESGPEFVEKVSAVDVVATPEPAVPGAAEAAPASPPESLQADQEPCNSEEPAAAAPTETQKPAAAATDLVPLSGLNRQQRRAWLKEHRKLAKRERQPLRMAA